MKDFWKKKIHNNANLITTVSKPSVAGIITGKLFEYLYIAREIMAVGVDETTILGKLINDTQIGITKIKKNNIGNNRKNYKLIQEFERKNQAMKILSMVE